MSSARGFVSEAASTGAAPVPWSAWAALLALALAGGATACGPKPALRLPPNPRSIPWTAEAPELPAFALPSPEVRIATTTGLPPLRARTLALSVRQTEDAAAARSLLERQARGAAPTASAKASLTLSVALQHARPPEGSAASAAARTLAYDLVHGGLAKLIPLHDLNGVSAEIRRKGSATLGEEVRVWGAVAQVAQLGRCTQADTVLDIELLTSELTTLRVAPADRQDYEQAHAKFRQALEGASEARAEALRTYRADFERAENAYRESGGAYSPDEDDPAARGVEVRKRFRSKERSLAAELDTVRSTLQRYPATPDDALRAEIERRKASGKPLGVMVRARARLVDVDTGRLLLLMDVDVAGRDAPAAGEALAKLVVERLLAAPAALAPVDLESE